MRRSFGRLNNSTIVMKVMTVFNSIMGLRQFDDSKGKPRVLFSLLYLAIVWSLLTVFLLHMLGFRKADGGLAKHISFFYMYPYMASSYYLTFMGFYHSKTFLVYKKRMLKVDENLYRLGVPPEYRELFFNSMILIIAWFSVIVISFGLSIKAFISLAGVWNGVYLLFVNYYILNIGPLVLLDFVICVKSVEARFEKVNDLLEAFAREGFQTRKKKNSARSLLPVIPLRTNMHNWRQPQINLTPVENLSRTEKQWEYIEKKNWRLRLIKLVHLDLCLTLKILFKTFGAQVTVQITLEVMSITLKLYDIYVSIVQSPLNVQSVLFNAWIFINCIIEFLRLFLLNRACEYAFREAEKALSILHACYPSLNDTVMKDEVRKHRYEDNLTLKKRSAITSIVLQWVNAITTHLVILIQFNESLKPIYTSTVVNNSITDEYKDP